MAKAIFIEWQVQESEFVGWNYVGGGYTDPIFRPITVTKSACWSSDITDENIAKAEAYCQKQRLDAIVVVKEDTRK